MFCAVSVCCAVNKESCVVNKYFVLYVYSIVLCVYMYIVFVYCVCAVSMTTTPDTNTRTQHNKENNKVLRLICIYVMCL